MPDTYTSVVNNPVGKLVASQLGLPRPVPLQRFEPGDPLLDGPALLGGGPSPRALPAVARTLAAAGAEAASELRPEVRQALADAGLDAAVFNPEAPPGDEVTFKAVVFDATGIPDVGGLDELHRFFHPSIRRVRPSGRLVVLATPPDALRDDPRAATAQRAVEGFVRAAGKELRGGATANLVLVDPGAEDALDSTLRFLLSPRSAYVSGQVVHVSEPPEPPPTPDPGRPLDGRIALVTGASRGIGEAIARVLARDGAHVVGLDVPPLAGDLEALTTELGGEAFVADITAAEAPREIADFLVKAHGGVDVVVHNAGITRDKTLGRMSRELWHQVLDVNLAAQERIDAVLLDEDVLRRQGRLVGVSSISGIAGNAGQTNYSTSKAAVIGRVQALAPGLRDRAVTINAVAPGFIETAMTAAMPVPVREAGRRMNSMRQGGLPVDVAEAIAWLAQPASAGVTGNVVRVCGQSLIGA